MIKTRKRTQTKLYHYCSIDSFFHIMNSKSIWLSNSDQMNDSNENIWIERYFDIVNEELNDSKYDELKESAFNMYRWNSNPSYIFCLSARKDLLSQWRAYSNDGSGVSIGFDIKSLKIQKGIPSPNVNEESTLGLAKIEYLTYKQKKKVRDLCKKIKLDYEKVRERIDEILINLELGKSLIDWALIFKNSSFQEEKEWRIIHTPTDNYENPLDNLSDLKFRLSQNKIITYFEYNFKSDFDSNLIHEVVIGPKCKMTSDEIRLFLDKNNLAKTKITYSKSTYR